MKKLSALIGLSTILLITGCDEKISETTPFEEVTVPEEYPEDVQQDIKFLEELDSRIELNPARNADEYISYAKTMCVLFDQTDYLESQVIDVNEDTQPVSDLAIEIYCPHHLDNIK